MKIEFLAFPTDRFPCFGFTVCSENGKLYLPEYNAKDTVCNFEEADFKTMYLQKYEGEYNIDEGENRIYAYRLLNEKKPIVGTMETISTQLAEALFKITQARSDRHQKTVIDTPHTSLAISL